MKKVVKFHSGRLLHFQVHDVCDPRTIEFRSSYHTSPVLLYHLREGFLNHKVIAQMITPEDAAELENIDPCRFRKDA